MSDAERLVLTCTLRNTLFEYAKPGDSAAADEVRAACGLPSDATVPALVSLWLVRPSQAALYADCAFGTWTVVVPSGDDDGAVTRTEMYIDNVSAQWLHARACALVVRAEHSGRGVYSVREFAPPLLEARGGGAPEPEPAPERDDAALTDAERRARDAGTVVPRAADEWPTFIARWRRRHRARAPRK